MHHSATLNLLAVASLLALILIPCGAFLLCELLFPIDTTPRGSIRVRKRR